MLLARFSVAILEALPLGGKRPRQSSHNVKAQLRLPINIAAQT
jgi:hypothetical protein